MASSAPAIVQHKVQWSYILPVAGAPIAHIFVSATKASNNVKQKKLLLLGVVTSTALAVVTRLLLMDHAYRGPDEKPSGMPPKEGPWKDRSHPSVRRSSRTTTGTATSGQHFPAIQVEVEKVTETETQMR
jgi:hypothetical protein